MYKLSSLFFIFFSLGLFFLVVGILTDKNDEKIGDIEKKQESYTNSDPKVLLIGKEKSIYLGKSQDSLKEEKKSNQKSNNLGNMLKSVEKKLDNTIIIKEVAFIQFGAFSKKKNAEDKKKEIDFKIKKKFKDFRLKIISNEDNKIHKLVYGVKEIQKATEICNYSKIIKIDCYVRKK